MRPRPVLNVRRISILTVNLREPIDGSFQRPMGFYFYFFLSVR